MSKVFILYLKWLSKYDLKSAQYLIMIPIFQCILTDSSAVWLLVFCASFRQSPLLEPLPVALLRPHRSATPPGPCFSASCLLVYAKNLNQTYTHTDECTCTHVEPFFASIGMCRKTFFWPKVFAALRNWLLLLSLMMMKVARRKRGKVGKAEKGAVGGGRARWTATEENASSANNVQWGPQQ